MCFEGFGRLVVNFVMEVGEGCFEDIGVDDGEDRIDM